MKKFLKTLLILSLVLALVACGGQEGQEPEGDDNGDVSEDTGEKIKVALMVEELGDLSFNDSAEEGLNRAEEDFDLDVKIIEYGDDPNQIESTLLDTADADYDVLIAPSQFTDYYQEFAADYPDITFILFDSEVDYDEYDVENVYSIVYNANEASYLAGYLAAKQSEEGVLGFLGGEELPIINDFLLGFIDGALLADEDVKIHSSFADSWSDSARGKELTNSMIDGGADIIFAAAGGSGIGMFESVAEKGGLAIGVDSDQALIFEDSGKEDMAELTLTSVMKNVGDSLYRALELYTKDELKVGETEALGIKENGVGLADNKYYQELVDEELRNELAEISEQISSGEIEIRSYYTMDPQEFDELRNSVRP